VGSPDGKTLYVADIRAKKTYRFDIRSDGSLANQKLFCELGSDGMTLDREGNLYLTGRGVTVFNPKGKQIEHIEVPQRWTANVCFGGEDFQTLFITASTGLYSLKMSVKGNGPGK
jgi:gluconolactonase